MMLHISMLCQRYTRETLPNQLTYRSLEIPPPHVDGIRKHVEISISSYICQYTGIKFDDMDYWLGKDGGILDPP